MVRILEHSTREDRATEQKRRELEREERQEEREKEEEVGKTKKGGGRGERYLQKSRKFPQVFSYVQISAYICDNYQRLKEKNTQKN